MQKDKQTEKEGKGRGDLNGTRGDQNRQLKCSVIPSCELGSVVAW